MRHLRSLATALPLAATLVLPGCSSSDDDDDRADGVSNPPGSGVSMTPSPGDGGFN